MQTVPYSNSAVLPSVTRNKSHSSTVDLPENNFAPPENINEYKHTKPSAGEFGSKRTGGESNRLDFKKKNKKKSSSFILELFSVILIY
jgi:hypothetical protein